MVPFERELGRPVVLLGNEPLIRPFCLAENSPATESRLTTKAGQQLTLTSSEFPDVEMMEVLI